MGRIRTGLHLAAPLIAGLLVAGCGISPTEDTGFIAARQRLNAAQADAQVREFAVVPLEDAERTLRSAGDADDQRQLRHLVYLTEKKIDIARAVAERRVAEERLRALQTQAEAQAERLKLTQEIERERMSTQLREAQAAQQRNEALQTQLSQFQARATARGTVLTLSDVLFDSGKAQLNPGTERSLDSLVNYLRENPERRIVIEGYTDNTGSPEGNLKLSLARADAVKRFLADHGIDSSRISTLGHGQNYPVVSNDTMAGRQRNRRVEILIERPDAEAVRDAERRPRPIVPAAPDRPAGPAG